MARKNSKKGGSTMEYTKLFKYPLSPCYKPPAKPAGWHSGGGNCIKNLSVSEMGIVDIPGYTKQSASEIAWDARYSCPDATKQKGGFTVNEIVNNSNVINNNTGNSNANKNGNKNANKNRNNNVNNNVNKNVRTNNNSAENNTNTINKNVNKNVGNNNSSLMNKLRNLINEENKKDILINAHKEGVNVKIHIHSKGNKKYKVEIKKVKKNNNNTNVLEETFNYNTTNGVVNRIQRFQLKSVSRKNNSNNNSNNNKKVTFNI